MDPFEAHVLVINRVLCTEAANVFVSWKRSQLSIFSLLHDWVNGYFFWCMHGCYPISKIAFLK